MRMRARHGHQSSYRRRVTGGLGSVLCLERIVLAWGSQFDFFCISFMNAGGMDIAGFCSPGAVCSAGASILSSV